jgi:hypothetical protein
VGNHVVVDIARVGERESRILVEVGEHTGSGEADPIAVAEEGHHIGVVQAVELRTDLAAEAVHIVVGEEEAHRTGVALVVLHTG